MRFFYILLVFVFSLTPFLSFGLEKSRTEKVGDDLQIALPALAFGFSYWKGVGAEDRFRYTLPFVKSFSYGLLTVHGIKQGANKSRPNESNNRSMPSGHTFAAFSGASFLNSLYGPVVGSVAYSAAAFVGYSRIVAQQHYADDVLAGAMVASLFNLYFTEGLENENSPSLTLAEAHDTTVVNVAVPTDRLTANKSFHDPKVTMKFLLGPSYVDDIAIFQDGIELFDLADLGSRQNATVSAALDVAYLRSEKSRWDFHLEPFEIRNTATLPNDFKFTDQTFSSGDNVQSIWAQYDADLAYMRMVAKNKGLGTLRLGAGLYGYYSHLKLSSLDSSRQSSMKFGGYIPFLAAETEWRILRQLDLTMGVAGFDMGQLHLFRGQVLAAYRLNKRWSVGVLGKFFTRRLKLKRSDNVPAAGSIVNESGRIAADLSVAYHFF